jgi:hypothetical protein
MEVQEFKRILELGLGRAITFLQTHDATPYHDVILDACLHDKRYERQFEYRRSTYLFDIINLTHAQSFFREQIIQALQNASDPNTDDALQLTGLVTRFAEQGDQEARKIVYDHFLKHVTSDEYGDGTRTDQLIDLDGVEGFLFAIECYAEQLPDNPDDFAPPYHFPDRKKNWDDNDRAFWKAAVERAGDNPSVAAYVMLEEQRRRASRKRRSELTKSLRDHSYEELKVAIANERREYGLAQWGEQASEDDLKRAATDFLTLDKQVDLVTLRKYLHIFCDRAFPFDPEPIIELAAQALINPWERDENGFLTPTSRVTLAALNALGSIHHPQIRQLAFDLIEKPQWLSHAAILLKSNWQESDWMVLETLTRGPLDPEEYHGLGFDIKDLFEAHPSPTAAQTLINIYEYGPCSECRMHVVEDLYGKHLLPDWMRDECRYDANSDLREWVENL